MNEREIKRAWRELRDQLDADAVAARMSQDALLSLSAAYRATSTEERPSVDAEIAEWLLDDDAGLRFDALALVC